jgi:hypothetical protein
MLMFALLDGAFPVSHPVIPASARQIDSLEDARLTLI